MVGRVIPIHLLRVVIGMQLDPADPRARVQELYRFRGNTMPAEACGQVSRCRYELFAPTLADLNRVAATDLCRRLSDKDQRGSCEHVCQRDRQVSRLLLFLFRNTPTRRCIFAQACNGFARQPQSVVRTSQKNWVRASAH